MDPIEAALAIVPIVSELAPFLVHVAAPKLHPKLPTVLPGRADVASIRALIDRYAEAAARFEANEGLLGGADRFVRAARTLRRMEEGMTGWQPSLQAPPQPLVDVARLALRHLGIDEPDGGWDAYDGAAPPAGD